MPRDYSGRLGKQIRPGLGHAQHGGVLLGEAYGREVFHDVRPAVLLLLSVNFPEIKNQK